MELRMSNDFEWWQLRRMVGYLPCHLSRNCYWIDGAKSRKNRTGDGLCVEKCGVSTCDVTIYGEIINYQSYHKIPNNLFDFP